jgi:hypothetical protein
MMMGTLNERISPESRMQVSYGMKDARDWMSNTIVRCEEDGISQAENAAWTLRKVIAFMENPVALKNLKTLLEDLESIDTQNN